MAIAQSFIIYVVTSFLVHSLTPYCFILRLIKVFFLLLLYFWLPYCFLLGIRFSTSCVFIFYIVFSFSFCLLQTFVIHGNYLIENKNKNMELKLSQYFYLLMEKPLGCYFQVWSPYIMRHSAARKFLFLYTQGDRSGLKKPKKE